MKFISVGNKKFIWNSDCDINIQWGFYKRFVKSVNTPQKYFETNYENDAWLGKIWQANVNTSHKNILKRVFSSLEASTFQKLSVWKRVSISKFEYFEKLRLHYTEFQKLH